jgi:hypothetical protein
MSDCAYPARTLPVLIARNLRSLHATVKARTITALHVALPGYVIFQQNVVFRHYQVRSQTSFPKKEAEIR